MRFGLICGLITATLSMAALPAVAQDLQVTVQNVKKEGEVRLSLFNKSENWLKRSYKSVKGVAAGGELTLTFTDIPDGDYAVAFYQDENGDGKMNSNVMGIPTEPYGFSNNARGTFGPPGFDAAKFHVDESRNRISVSF